MTREATNKLLEMVEEGLLDRDTVIMACVKYMSEDEVEDMWMRGARYGTVVGLSLTPKDRVRVRMDKATGTRAGTADTFRRI